MRWVFKTATPAKYGIFWRIAVCLNKRWFYETAVGADAIEAIVERPACFRCCRTTAPSGYPP